MGRSSCHREASPRRPVFIAVPNDSAVARRRSATSPATPRLKARRQAPRQRARAAPDALLKEPGANWRNAALVEVRCLGVDEYDWQASVVSSPPVGAVREAGRHRPHPNSKRGRSRLVRRTGSSAAATSQRLARRLPLCLDATVRCKLLLGGCRGRSYPEVHDARRAKRQTPRSSAGRITQIGRQPATGSPTCRPLLGDLAHGHKRSRALTSALMLRGRTVRMNGRRACLSRRTIGWWRKRCSRRLGRSRCCSPT